MKKVVVFGAGGTGQRVARLAAMQYEVIAFTDNDKTKWGGALDNIRILSPKEALFDLQYDYVLIGSLMGLDELKEQLCEMQIPEFKVKTDYAEFSVNSRICFLKRFAEIAVRENIGGSVGEAGVFRGEFAKEINKYFSDRKCYLFDTFDGFAEDDIAFEQKDSMVTANYMKGLSEQLVYEKMPHKEKVHIYKGYFPETAIRANIEDSFCFVNLDMDLYKPTYEGIKYFYPKMSKKGVILIHDYFSDAYPNVKQALDDYEHDFNIILVKTPIGDDISIAIVKE